MLSRCIDFSCAKLRLLWNGHGRIVAEVHQYPPRRLHYGRDWHCGSVCFCIKLQLSMNFLTGLLRPWQLLTTGTKFLQVLSGFGVFMAPAT